VLCAAVVLQDDCLASAAAQDSGIACINTCLSGSAVIMGAAMLSKAVQEMHGMPLQEDKWQAMQERLCSSSRSIVTPGLACVPCLTNCCRHIDA
jgi:hypothetical protein